MMTSGVTYCPLRRKKCVENCAWNLEGTCAICQLVMQAHRQGDELYTIAEVALHAPFADSEEETHNE